MFGSSGFTATCPLSETPTSYQSTWVIAPMYDRVATLTAVPSCCVP